MGRSCAVTGMLLVSALLVRADGIGKPSAAVVAKAFDEVKADLERDQAGAELLAAASRARAGMPAVGMKGIPQVAGDARELLGKGKGVALKSKAVKIVQLTRSCAVGFLGRVKNRLFGR